MNALVCADNLEVLRRLPDGRLHLIYVDPPFGTGSRRRGAAGGYDDPRHLEAYLDWLRPRLVGFHRVLAPSGSLFIHLDWRTVHYVRVELDKIFGDRLVNEIIWCYSVGGKSRRAFGRKHDTLLWYGRAARPAFYPDAVRIARKPHSHMKVESDADGRPVQVKRDRETGRIYRYPVHAGKVPEDYWTDIETLNRGDRERTGWPSQKPEALLERIIRATTQPGDWVADFFAGSGTAAVVAARLGRRFLAVDDSPDAVAVTRARLRKAGLELPEDRVPHL
ncbi:MAG TPA: site-specific DNA-methyltransferase [Haliangiales bacterium]|nr:site-specific DNA-methyltransferase [Haliangiales bacterium]